MASLEQLEGKPKAVKAPENWLLTVLINGISEIIAIINCNQSGLSSCLKKVCK